MTTRTDLILAIVVVLLAAVVPTAPATAANLLVNPDFDSSLDPWRSTNLSKNIWSSVDAADDPSSGSARGLIDQEPPFSGIAFRQCVQVAAGTTYDIGASALIPSGQGPTGSARAVAYFYGNDTCNPGDLIDNTTVGSVDAPGTWMEISDTLEAPAGSGSANLMFSIFKASGSGDLVAHFDDAFFCQPGQCEEAGLDGEWFTDPLYPDFRFRAQIVSEGTEVATNREDVCQEDTVCVSGAVPGRTELFIRILGPRPNGYLWPTLVRFTPSGVKVEMEQLSTGTRKLYTLPAVPPGEENLSGIQDRMGFLP